MPLLSRNTSSSTIVKIADTRGLLSPKSLRCVGLLITLKLDTYIIAVRTFPSPLHAFDALPNVLT